MKSVLLQFMSSWVQGSSLCSWLVCMSISVHSIMTGVDFNTITGKFLLTNLPEGKDVSENQLRMALKQKKFTPKWVMSHFLDPSTALVSVRLPRKSRNSNFTMKISGKNVKAIKLTEVEEAEFELMLNSETAEMFSSAMSLRNFVENATNQMIEVQSQDLFQGKRGDIKFDLLASTSKHYQYFPFGSRVVGLGFVNSDYDVFVDMGNFYKGGGETEMKNSVQLIRDKLRRSKLFSDFILIPRARVPVLKVKHKRTQVHCDISSVNGIGVENSRLIRNYLSDKRVRFVATAVKLWSRQLGLTQAAQGPGAFSSYCLLWLVLFALMQVNPPAVTPVVNLKQNRKGQKLFIDGWDCSFCDTPPPQSKNKMNEIQLLHYFFNFYSSIDYRDVVSHVICPYLGTMIPVREFVTTKSLPKEFDNYKKQAAQHSFYKMSCSSLMHLQDPVEQNHNVAKAVEDWVLDRFLKLCSTSALMMGHTMGDMLVETS